MTLVFDTFCIVEGKLFIIPCLHISYKYTLLKEKCFKFEHINMEYIISILVKSNEPSIFGVTIFTMVVRIAC